MKRFLAVVVLVVAAVVGGAGGYAAGLGPLHASHANTMHMAGDINPPLPSGPAGPGG